MKTELKRVLILSVFIGSGHVKAAEAIQKRIQQIFPNAQMKNIDILRDFYPLLTKAITILKKETIKRLPAFYHYFYYQAENGFAKEEINELFIKTIAPKLRLLIDSFQPQVILATHFFPLGILSSLKQKKIIQIPVLAVVTDFKPHLYWVYPAIDRYCVATQKTKEFFAGYDYDQDKVVVTGMPIDPEFSLIRDKKKIRENLGLRPDRPIILIMGGGLGIGPIEKIVKNLINHSTDYQLLVVCGHNQRLKKRLNQLVTENQKRMQVFGFVDNVPELMAAADLIVGKAGGLTSAEALATGLPFFVIKPIPGQEENNTQFLIEGGAALKTESIKHLLAEIDYHLSQRQYLEKMSIAARRLVFSDPTKAVIEVMQTLIK